MKKTSIFIIMLALALSANVFGQATKPAGETEADTPIRGGQIAIPDDGYDGTLASMACRTINRTGTDTIVDASVTVEMEHTWIGDLTIKLVSPAGTVATVLSRPGSAEASDDGVDGPPFGDSSNLALSSPITFSTTDGLVDAEQMGETIGGSLTVCADDAECLFTPNPGAASDSGDLTNLFAGETPAGDWQLCVGDSNGVDTGNLGAVTLDLTLLGTPPIPPDPLPEATPVPTTNFLGMLLLVLTLGGLGMFLVGRRGA